MGAPVRVVEQGKPMMEQLAARWVMAFSMVVIGAFSLIRFLPSPTGLPEYARFLPVDVSPEQIIGHESQGTAIPTISVTPTATIPSTAIGIATVTVDSANCREKPRGGADKVVFLYKGQQVEVLGRNDDPVNPWWYVKIPDGSGYCWVWGMTTTMNGNIEEIPVVR